MSFERPTSKLEFETKFKNYKKILLRLMRNSKLNHFNNFFHENLFKTREGIREIVNISKKGKTDITSIYIGKKKLLKSLLR